MAFVNNEKFENKVFRNLYNRDSQQSILNYKRVVV